MDRLGISPHCAAPTPSFRSASLEVGQPDFTPPRRCEVYWNTLAKFVVTMYLL